MGTEQETCQARLRPGRLQQTVLYQCVSSLVPRHVAGPAEASAGAN